MRPSRFWSRCIGMTGWGKKHSAFLDLAAGKTGLTQPQIQVCLLDECYLLVSLALVFFFCCRYMYWSPQNWIRWENMPKRKHAASEGNESHLPVKKAQNQQSWYQYLKNYAQTEGMFRFSLRSSHVIFCEINPWGAHLQILNLPNEVEPTLVIFFSGAWFLSSSFSLRKGSYIEQLPFCWR